MAPGVQCALRSFIGTNMLLMYRNVIDCHMYLEGSDMHLGCKRAGAIQKLIPRYVHSECMVPTHD